MKKCACLILLGITLCSAKNAKCNDIIEPNVPFSVQVQDTVRSSVQSYGHDNLPVSVDAKKEYVVSAVTSNGVYGKGYYINALGGWVDADDFIHVCPKIVTNEATVVQNALQDASAQTLNSETPSPALASTNVSENVSSFDGTQTLPVHNETVSTPAVTSSVSSPKPAAEVKNVESLDSIAIESSTEPAPPFNSNPAPAFNSAPATVVIASEEVSGGEIEKDNAEFMAYVCGPNSPDPSIPCGSIPPEFFYNADLYPVTGQANIPSAPRPRDNSAKYNKDSAKFRKEIERGSWQAIQPDNRTFVALARNYANRLHCDGTISDVVYPTDKGLEIKILNGGHDVFLRVGSTVPQSYSYFPVDLNVICNEQVYQLNGVIDAKYPAMNVELVQNASKLNEKNILKYSSTINKAEALPHEQKITKLMQRVYRDKKMQFWVSQDVNKRFSQNNIVFYLRQHIETNIDDIVAWDFAVENVNVDIPTLLESLRHAVVGEIVSIGRVRYGNGQRVVILSVVDKE